MQVSRLGSHRGFKIQGRGRGAWWCSTAAIASSHAAQTGFRGTAMPQCVSCTRRSRKPRLMCVTGWTLHRGRAITWLRSLAFRGSAISGPTARTPRSGPAAAASAPKPAAADGTYRMIRMTSRIQEFHKFMSASCPGRLSVIATTRKQEDLRGPRSSSGPCCMDPLDTRRERRFRQGHGGHRLSTSQVLHRGVPEQSNHRTAITRQGARRRRVLHPLVWLS